MKESRKISGDDTGDPVSVRQSGCLWGSLTICAMISAFCMIGVISILQDSNKLKRAEIDIQKQRLEVARKQYLLDSLKFYTNDKKR